MDPLIALAGIAGAILIGAVSPGPSFVVVARTAIASSRLDGLAVALGMGLGGALFATAAILGLQAVLMSAPAVYLGRSLWNEAGEPLTMTDVKAADQFSQKADMTIDSQLCDHERTSCDLTTMSQMGQHRSCGEWQFVCSKHTP